MHHWKINNFLIVALSIHLLTLIFVGIGDLGFNVPVLRQVIGFIDLTFIPGLLILRAMGLSTLPRIEKMLYSVGLSLFVSMAIGLLINSLYPLLGIGKPISSWPFLITITAVLLILGIFTYKKDTGSSLPEKACWRQIFSPSSLFLILIPLISILGTQLVNVYHSNILLLILILLISLVPIVIVFTKFIREELYLLAICMIALALLFHVSLISNYLTGYDIHVEYYFANLVRINSIWDATVPNSYNAMLSVAMLGPIYSLICGMDLTWVFKIIYPLLYSFVPLGIYMVCNRQVNSKISFLAAFFFIAVNTFYMEMISLARQEIAELFLTLILLVVVTKQLNATAQKALFLIFSASLVISHYSISYIFCFSILVAWILRFLIQYATNSRLLRNIKGLTREGEEHKQIVTQAEVNGNKLITFGFVSFFFVATIAWYMWQASSFAFKQVTFLINNIFGHVLTEFMSIFSSEALWLIVSPTMTPLHEVTKYLGLFTIALIAAGILQLVRNWRAKKFNEDYALLSLVSFVLVAAAIPLPYMASALNTTRLYHIALIFLAPFCITGSIAIYKFVVKDRQGKEKLVLKIVSTILAVFLLFNTGFVYEMAKDYPVSISLSQESIKKHATNKTKAQFYSNYTTEEEVVSSLWLSNNIGGIYGKNIYATFPDPNIGEHTLASYGMMPRSALKPLVNSTQILENGAYIYLRYLNVLEGIGTMVRPPLNHIETFDMAVLRPLLMGANKIYTSKGIEILLVP
jgi:uncharacterized membrane protein